MVNIIRIISKYLILVFMALYVWKCFSYFTTSDRRKRRSNLNRQVFLIFAIHGLCHVCMYLNTKEAKLFIYYAIEILIAALCEFIGDNLIGNPLHTLFQKLNHQLSP